MNCIHTFLIIFFLLYNSFIFSYTRNIILLGSIHLSQSTDTPISFPIRYKGNKYQAKIDLLGDTKNAFFEIYETQDLQELFILITDYLSIPQNGQVSHLYTSEKHPYRLFYLTKKMHYDMSKKIQYIWDVKELPNTNKKCEVPDNTIIAFIPADLFDKIENSSLYPATNIVQLPALSIKKIKKEKLVAIINQVNLSALDFEPLHKKPHATIVLCADQHVLSLPMHQSTTQS